MILVLAGTGEGREVIKLLSKQGYEIVAIAATDYGRQLVLQDGGKDVLVGEVNSDTLTELFKHKQIMAVIDISHPFESTASRLLQEFSVAKGILHIRFIREETKLPENPLIYPAFSWEEAVQTAFSLGRTIFLTTGSYNLELFLHSELAKEKRVVVRVLPEHQVIQKCQKLGLSPKDIIAMQGPYSKEMNRVTFKAYNASVVVTKDSGKAGGTDTKISAAIALKIPVVVIKRPQRKETNQATNYTEIIKILEAHFGK